MPTATKLNLNDAYDSFGNITRYYDSATWNYFAYDHQNRLKGQVVMASITAMTVLAG